MLYCILLCRLIYPTQHDASMQYCRACHGDYKTGFGLINGFIGFWYDSCLHFTNHLKHTDRCSLSRFLQRRTSLCTDPLDWVYLSTTAATDYLGWVFTRQGPGPPADPLTISELSLLTNSTELTPTHSQIVLLCPWPSFSDWLTDWLASRPQGPSYYIASEHTPKKTPPLLRQPLLRV
jgi:hypothetical protein